MFYLGATLATIVCVYIAGVVITKDPTTHKFGWKWPAKVFNKLF